MKLNLYSRRWLIEIVALACTAGCVASDDGSFEDEISAIEQEVVTGAAIVGVESGRCLDVKSNSSAPGTPLQIYQCHGGSNQSFSFTPAGELRGFSGTVCVEATAHGAPVVIAGCSGQPKQQWRHNANGTITAQQSGLCLDVKAHGTENRSVVQLWTCTGGANQRWSTAAPDSQPPTPPSGIAVSNVTCNSATLSWAGSTDNVGVAFYDIYHDGQLMKSEPGSASSTSITVVPGVTWGLYVNARDAAGNVSQASDTLNLTPPQCQIDTQPPTAPTGLSGSASGTSVTLTWSGSTDNLGVAGYDIHRGGVKVGSTAGATATSFVDSGLSSNTSYAYFVVARDAQANISAHSNTVNVTTGQSCTSAICTTTQITTDTDIPWGLVNLPDGTLLYAQRDVHSVIRLNPSTGQKSVVGTLADCRSTDGEGGLMGLAISANFASDRWLYIMYTTENDNRIVRVKYVNNAIDTGTMQVLVSGILRNKFHNGGRLRFGPDGKLYAATGDAQNGAHAQNKNGLNGKILRINPDGSVPSDNPFNNYVWSYGHRNPQGLAFDSLGRLWQQEFGNGIMDETNLVERGGNYGWPDCEGTSSQSGSGCGTAGYIAPKQTYSTASGSCSGIAIVRDVLYVACGRGARMYRMVISGSSLTGQQQFFNGVYGRLRTVEPTPDGNIWLTTTNQGDKDSIPNNSNEKILRVVLGIN